jgi:hypothetical protein
MVDSRKFFNPGFVKFEEVANGPKRKDLVEIKEGKFGKLDAIFSDGTALSLNATNTRVLTKMLGPETDDWPGHTVELYGGKIRFGGEDQPAVLVREVSNDIPFDR